MRQKIRRTSLRKPSSRTEPPAKQSIWDLWLVRGSHVAQFGLFILTLWALFYTVIPLYRTAALEEQIARREVELKTLEQKLAETDQALKAANEKMYHRSRDEVLRGLVISAGAQCSGLLRPVAPLLRLREKPRPPRPLLDIDVAECLGTELVKRKPETVLRPEDLHFLRDTIDRKAATLAQDRSDSLSVIDQMRTKDTAELEAIAQRGPVAQYMEELLDDIGKAYPGGPLRSPKAQHESALRYAQEQVAREFEERVRVEIGKLRELKWPERPS